MALTAAELDRLEANIAAAQVWVEGDENAEGTADNGRMFDSITKVNAAATAAFDAHIATLNIVDRIAFRTRVDLQAAAAGLPDGLYHVWADLNLGRLGAYQNTSGVIVKTGGITFDELSKLA